MTDGLDFFDCSIMAGGGGGYSREVQNDYLLTKREALDPFVNQKAEGRFLTTRGPSELEHRTADDEFAGYRLWLATRRAMHGC